MSLDGGFELTGVAHLVRPAGEEASDIDGLRGAISRVPERSLFYHTSARKLQHPAADELPPDDLSHWLAGVVQDRETAERVEFVVESQSGSLEELRQALLERLDAVPEKLRKAHDCPPGGEFVFLTVDSVPVPTGERVADAGEMVEALLAADPSVWFYHLVEQPCFEPAERTLGEWFRRRGHGELADRMASAVRGGRPLSDIRRRVLRSWRLRGLGSRIAAASLSAEHERIETGRAVVSRLARRIRRAEDAQ